MHRLLLIPLLAAALVGCSDGSPSGAPAPALSGAPTDSDRDLRALLLQPADLPDQQQRRESGSTAATTQLAPQLALCRPLPEVAPHRVASVLAKPGKPGEAEVFEVLSAFADEQGAQEAYDAVLAAARACPEFEQQGTAFTVDDLAEIDVAGADAALHYRLRTPDVISGDVRTVGRSGRFLVMVTGFGAPKGGQPLLDYQADLLAAALDRLPD